MKKILLLLWILPFCLQIHAQRIKFNNDWLFRLDTANTWNDQTIWNKTPESVTLPHDWSINLPFDKYSPSGNRGASLRGGLGIYEKTFTLNDSDRDKKIFIVFDGVYMNSTVSINGHTLGTRPFGYISFEYDLTPFLKLNGEKNRMVVRVENKQPNSRWYSGSGIYRNVWLDKRGAVYVKNWGTYITTPKIESNNAEVSLQTELESTKPLKNVAVITSVFDPSGKQIKQFTDSVSPQNGNLTLLKNFSVDHPQLWSPEQPAVYKIHSEVKQDNATLHEYTSTFGIRSFHFDQEKGFFLNGKYLKIIGACMHHDLGALGAAVNVSAMRRQLEMLKSMGMNAVRTSHNPPAPEWLQLCDEMGLLVMDETFDVWTWDKESTPYNYNLYFNDWHERDLTDHIKRDRNHPSIIMWSIGNEISEQVGTGADTIGRSISRTMVNIIKKVDTTRPVTAGMNFANNQNNLYASNALDVIGVNYHHRDWPKLGSDLFPSNKPYILTETISALTTRGAYDFPSDSIRRWAGFKENKNGGNADLTCSSFENCSAPWGSTNEQALKLFLKYPYLSGMFLWTGFDYLGEPTPYPFPARSSYFGIIDMAGFPKDAYYLYKSIFTKNTVLHILPHWNWEKGQKVDVHVYFNNADEVELFVNGKSQGKKRKVDDELFVRFNGITYSPGSLKAVSKKAGKKVAEEIVPTAGVPYQLIAQLESNKISANGDDLAFVQISVVDKNGTLVPNANNTIHVEVSGEGSVASLDNGSQTDLEPFSNKKFRKAFNGKALAMIRSTQKAGKVQIKIKSDGLKEAVINLETTK